MIRYSLAIVFIVCCSQFKGYPQAGEGSLHLYAIGNLADLNGDSKEIRALSALVEQSTSRSIVVFTGDICTVDLTHPELRRKDSIRLHNILDKLQSPTLEKMVFIPGDRDWGSSGDTGWENALILEEILESLPYLNLKWSPGKGCPGPKSITLCESLEIIPINTQYWNHPHDKPAPTDALCRIASMEEFFEELEDLVSESGNKNILVTGHFPVASSGEYGGRMSWKQHIFPLIEVKPYLWVPLPVAGSFYPAYRQNVGSSMDIINERYDPFNEALKNFFQDHPGLIYVSGHDRLEEVLYLNESYFINSGGLLGHTPAKKTKGSVFCGKNPGIIRLEILVDGTVLAQAFRMDSEELIRDALVPLYQSPCSTPLENIPVNQHYNPCIPERVEEVHQPGTFGSTTVVAGEEYDAGLLKRWFLGAHYRKAWTTPVRVNYLNLDTTFGGLTPIKRGGGRQTTSLKFRSGKGCEYVFRSVNKDPKKALSYDLRETIVADVVKDQTSTQQPYGAMATTVMLDALDILHPHPVLYILPSDPRLGPFREEYSGLLGMLEESPKGPRGNCPGFGGSDEVLRSVKLFRKLYSDHDHRIDQAEFARAKIFDIFVGDWGRHEDNWKWAGYQQEGTTTYRPVPRDRDHVFSVWDGLLPWIADREWAKPSGDHFGKKVHDLRSLTWSARHLDRVVLTGLSKQEWMEQAAVVQQRISPDIIRHAMQNMPGEIYAESGQEIENKLLNRLNSLDAYAQEYYLMLARYVDVLGSSKKEVFRVFRQEDGSVQVTVTNKKANKVLYDRIFYPNETKEIRLFGLGNHDAFYVSGVSNKSILVRVVGGDGADTIVDKSAVRGMRKKTRIYERDAGSTVLAGPESKIVHARNDALYQYDRHAFAYNTYFPLPYIGYNSDDGLMLGLGISFKRQRYGKEAYASKHSLDLKASTSGNLAFKYEGHYHHVFRTWDLVYYGLLAYPTDYVYFFGYGNETIKSDSLYSANFYKTRYNSFQLGAGMLKEFLKRSRFTCIASYENNEGQISENTILDNTPDVLGTDNINLFEITAVLDLDFRNDRKFPERGMRLFTEIREGYITNQNSGYTRFLGFMELHSSIRTLLPVFIGIRGGGTLSSGDLPFYKLNNLGQNNFLQGFRKNRFTGRSTAFLNTDLKIQILDIATAVVPVKFGIRGFYDLGRVWIDGENSNKLHSGYGGGIYLVPLERNFSFALNMAFSEEEKNGLIVFDFGISF